MSIQARFQRTQKHTMRNTLILLNIVLLLANCVREVDFQDIEATQNDLVVSGRFTNLDEPHELRLMRPGDYNRQAFEPVRGATVTLRDDLGNSWNYLEVSNQRHYYVLDHKGEPGRSYTLRIQLPGGSVYETAPQTMPQPIALDDLTLTGEQIEFQRSTGGTALEPHCVVKANLTNPGAGFLRWDAFRVSIFNEIVKIYEIFPVQHQCFLTDNFNTQNVPITNLSELQSGTSIDLKIAQRKIDYTFQARQCYSVYQLTITKEAYEYWKKVNFLLAQNGSIFDAPPAVVPGNIYFAGEPGEPAALGFFEVCSADIKRKYLQNGDLGEEFRSFPEYCAYDWSRWPPVNHLECDNCLLLAGSSYEKPFYWQ
jgi:Domain of unknown function (DUF4249)